MSFNCTGSATLIYINYQNISSIGALFDWRWVGVFTRVTFTALT
jgi:hypothetical protein